MFKEGVEAHLQGGRALCGGPLQRGGLLQALTQRVRVALECGRLELRRAGITPLHLLLHGLAVQALWPLRMHS